MPRPPLPSSLRLVLTPGETKQQICAGMCVCACVYVLPCVFSVAPILWLRKAASPHSMPASHPVACTASPSLPEGMPVGGRDMFTGGGGRIHRQAQKSSIPKRASFLLLEKQSACLEGKEEGESSALGRCHAQRCSEPKNHFKRCKRVR